MNARTIHRYTSEEIEWIARNKPNYTSWVSLARDFNSRFGANLKPKTISYTYRRIVLSQRPQQKFKIRTVYFRPTLSEADAEYLEKRIFGRSS